MVHQGDFEARSDAELQGMRGVTMVTGELVIREGVTTLEPASCLQGVGTALRVYETQNLESLHGLDDLESAPVVDIVGNELLATTAGLGLREASSLVRVSQNHALTDLSFDNLETVGSFSLGECNWGEPGDPLYLGNDKLAHVNGFPSLSHAGTFAAYGQAALVSVQGLIQENADAISFAFFEANPKLDASAVRASWEAAGKTVDDLSTCGNLGDTEPCKPCPPPN